CAHGGRPRQRPGARALLSTTPLFGPRGRRRAPPSYQNHPALNCARVRSFQDRKAMKKLPNAELQRIREGFEFADTDRNGRLDFEEFSGLLKVLAPDSTVQQSAEGFSMVDTNSDGQ